VNLNDYEEFARATAGRDSEVDLFGAAMIVARLRDGQADTHAVARELDLIAEAARERAGETLDPETLSQAVDHELFIVRGFHGNSQEYGEPENSFLDQVLATRTGIPIALSLVYMEVAQRVGLRCDGIGYPGHFLVRCGDPESPIFVDPFNQGVRLDREELLAPLRGEQIAGASPESFLAAVTRRQILQRMLQNLHMAYRERRDLQRWLAVVELALRIEPWNAALVGERGMLYYRLGTPDLALHDLQRYVDSSEPGTVSAGARRLLDELRLRTEGSTDPR